MLLRHEYLGIGMKYISQGIKIYKSTPGTEHKKSPNHLKTESTPLRIQKAFKK